MRTYHNYAIQIISGTFPKEPYYYNPLYPYFVSLIYFIFGANPSAVRVIQALIGIFICFLIYLISKKIFEEKIAFIALFLSTIYGVFMVYEGYLLIETLFTFLITLSIFFLLRQNIILAGVSFGLSALTRANILIFLPFIFIWMILDKVSKKVVKFSLLCLIVFTTILPFTIRNYLVSGKFVLISTNGPVNFWMGNNKYADGQYYVPTFPFQILHAEKVQQEVKKKGNKAYLEDVLNFIREEPISYIKLQLKKFFLFWGTDEITNNISYAWIKNISSILRLPFIIDFGIIGPLGLTGVVLSLKNRKFGVCLLILFLVGYSLATIIFLVLSRYSLPIAPFLLIFSAFSIFSIYKSLRKKDVKMIILFLATLFSFICVLNVNKGIKLIYPCLFPNGVNLETEEGLWIKDTSDISRLTKAPSLLDSPNVSLKKELIINKNFASFKKAILFVDASIIPRKGAMLLFKVNERGPFYLDISDNIHPKEEFITTRISFPFEKEFLKEGKNVFELSVTKNGWVSVSADGSFCYKRSFFKNSPNEKWKEIDGEYQITLWLEKI